MLKTVLLILLFLLPTASGTAICRCIRLRRKQLDCAYMIAQEIETQIKYRALPLSEIIADIAQNEVYCCLVGRGFGCFGHNCTSEFAKHISNSDKCCLKNDEKQLIADFLCGLGKTDVDGQLDFCELYKQKLKALAERSDKLDQKKLRLYPPLGAFLGLFLVIMFI